MKYLKTFISGMLAGLSIALGGVVFLSLESRVLGALFFSVGLFTICSLGFQLYTGKVCYVFQNDRAYALQLPVMWAGNLAGTWLPALALRLTRIGPTLSERAAVLCETKLADTLPSLFLLGVFCDLLIYIAVEGFQRSPGELGKYLSVFFGVTVFILSGFEHCIADMFYISMAGLWSPAALVRILIITLGNSVGGVLIPLARRFLAA